MMDFFFVNKYVFKFYIIIIFNFFQFYFYLIFIYLNPKLLTMEEERRPQPVFPLTS